MPHYIRMEQPGGCYFFTIVTYRQRCFLTDELARHFLHEAIIKIRQNHSFEIDAWVLLPDYLHCIWTLLEGDDDYSICWNVIKILFTRRAIPHYHNIEWMNASKIKHCKSTLWQRRFWGRIIYDDRDYTNHVDYIHYNPIKRGWAEHPRDWSYSTYHC
ncbi:transposase [Candidatus Venteria ishoeyi]|uniref:REP-associated tyrosine transposase n=1 Tax=Candidatus Venteria ishoeyi TaxID=1899563 RepID=UPI0025A53B98|nr:transposase [Candidatus Venteria ishoeyi]MDM8546192.1 transposase [Candidatus Venteria ishoeyi]